MKCDRNIISKIKDVFSTKAWYEIVVTGNSEMVRITLYELWEPFIGKVSWEVIDFYIKGISLSYYVEIERIGIEDKVEAMKKFKSLVTTYKLGIK